jgi:hypothetical protein
VVVAVLVELGLDEQQGFAMQAAASTAAAAAATAGDAIRWAFSVVYFFFHTPPATKYGRIYVIG